MRQSQGIDTTRHTADRYGTGRQTPRDRRPAGAANNRSVGERPGSQAGYIEEKFNGYEKFPTRGGGRAGRQGRDVGSGRCGRARVRSAGRSGGGNRLDGHRGFRRIVASWRRRPRVRSVWVVIPCVKMFGKSSEEDVLIRLEDKHDTTSERNNCLPQRTHGHGSALIARGHDTTIPGP